MLCLLLNEALLLETASEMRGKKESMISAIGLEEGAEKDKLRLKLTSELPKLS